MPKNTIPKKRKQIVEKHGSLLFLMLLFSVFSSLGVYGQTTLYPNDLAFTGVNMDGTDEFSIVFLTAIDAGTEIKFTDNGWLASGDFRTGEDTYTWTAGSAYGIGDEIVLSSSGLSLSATGDQIIAYQNTSDIIAAINVEGAHVWQSDATDSNTSSLPSGLTNGENCVALDEYDNVQYDRSVTSGTKATILAAINDYSNWSGDNSTSYTLSSGTGSYSVSITAEPSAQPTGFGTGTITHKDIELNWTDDVGTPAADGYLIMLNLGGAFTDPTDGVPQVDDTDVADGNGVINIAPGVQTYTWTDLDPDQGYSFQIYSYTNCGSDIDYYITNPPQASGTTTSTPDADSYISDPTTQVSGVSISSLKDTDAEAVDVFTFKIIDQGTADGLSTLVDTITIRPQRSNTVDWSDAIQGAKLNDGSAITVSSVNITDAYIQFVISSGDLEIADGTSKEVTLSIYLNTSNIVDKETLSFYIDKSDHGFRADEYGSTFTVDPLTADINSNDFTLDVAASKLIFHSVPGDININTNFKATVWAADANGNLDLDDGSTVSLTDDGSGNISSATSLSGTLVNGSFEWTDLQYNVVESFNLTAADDATLLTSVATSITAYNTGVAIPGSIFISEFIADPTGTDTDMEWIELYNSNSFDVDIDGWTISDAGSDSHTINNGAALNIPSLGFLVLGINSSTSTNGNYTPDYVYTGITLTNTNDEIILSNDDTTPLEITRVEYDDSNGWTITAGSSLVFTGTADDDNNDASLWATSTVHEKAYLGTTNTDKGSPGTNGFQQNFSSSTTWSGSGNWSEGNKVGATNWSNGVPGAACDVTVDGTVTVDVDAPAACHDLTISSGNSVTLSPGTALTVNGDLTNSNGSSSGLILQADGTSGVSSLITEGSITGNAQVQSYFTDFNSWYLVSSPISDGLGGLFTDDIVYWYDEVNYTWQNPTNVDYPLTAGKGFAIYKTANNTVTYDGALNTGAVNSSLTYTYNSGHLNPKDGWNLMGNPYPSVLDISYLDYTDISNGVWVNLHNSTSDYYVYWSKTLGTVGSSGSGGGDDRARYIQPGQGFWIYTDVDGTAFDLDNSMRSHQNHGNFSKSTPTGEPIVPNLLKISIAGTTIVDPTYIVFRNDATVNFDREYDLYKMISSSPTVPHIYSLENTDSPQKLAINAIAPPNQETAIPLGVKVGTDGSYRLYIDGLNSFDESQDFYLRDNISGELYDLRQQNSISFNYLTTDPENRFDLVMGLQTSINNPLGISQFGKIYSAGNLLYIRPKENQKVENIRIQNLLGQIVYSGHFRESDRTGLRLNIPTAIYLVDIQTDSGNYSKKIFIQNRN
jgi:hypothetical protein